MLGEMVGDLVVGIYFVMVRIFEMWYLILNILVKLVFFKVV